MTYGPRGNPGAPRDPRPGDLLDHVLHTEGEAYALLHRPGAAGRDVVEVLTGSVSLPGTLADIPLPPRPAPG